jgi:hypothetical protein
LKFLPRFDNLKPDRTLVGANCAVRRWALTGSPGRAGSKRQIQHTSKLVRGLFRARPVFAKPAQLDLPYLTFSTVFATKNEK